MIKQLAGANFAVNALLMNRKLVDHSTASCSSGLNAVNRKPPGCGGDDTDEPNKLQKCFCVIDYGRPASCPLPMNTMLLPPFYLLQYALRIILKYPAVRIATPTGAYFASDMFY